MYQVSHTLNFLIAFAFLSEHHSLASESDMDYTQLSFNTEMNLRREVLAL
jgi:hypothetical protein